MTPREFLFCVCGKVTQCLGIIVEAKIKKKSHFKLYSYNGTINGIFIECDDGERNTVSIKNLQDHLYENPNHSLNLIKDEIEGRLRGWD